MISKYKLDRQVGKHLSVVASVQEELQKVITVAVMMRLELCGAVLDTTCNDCNKCSTLLGTWATKHHVMMIGDQAFQLQEEL